MVILEQLTDNTYVVEIDHEEVKNHREHEFGICHDYVWFKANQFLFTKQMNPEVKLFANNVCSNVVEVPQYVQIPIRNFVQVVLPYLQEHKYIQPEHLALRPKTANYEAHYGYTHSNSVVLYWKDNTKMAAVRLKGEPTYNHMTQKFYEEFVKPNLK